MKTKLKWVRFYELKWGEGFFLGSAKAEKANTFTAWRGGMRAFVSPWCKVRSLRPFGKQNRLDLINDNPRPSKPVALRVIPALTESVAGEEPRE